MSDQQLAAVLLHKIERFAVLPEAERQAVCDLPLFVRHYPPQGYLIREGEAPKSRCAFIVEGLAYRQKLTAEGTRQILSINMRGDLLDLQHLFLGCADHNVQALTSVVVAEVDRVALRGMARTCPSFSEALWVDSLIEASIFREWILNIGRRDARSRLAHLLCEFAVRMRTAGLTEDIAFDLPMTQEQIGDATGLTSVHVNRTLRSLESAGLVRRDKRRVILTDWARIQEVADFNPRYLHLDQIDA